jgi:hypothetical protein
MNFCCGLISRLSSGSHVRLLFPSLSFLSFSLSSKAGWFSPHSSSSMSCGASSATALFTSAYRSLASSLLAQAGFSLSVAPSICSLSIATSCHRCLAMAAHRDCDSCSHNRHSSLVGHPCRPFPGRERIRRRCWTYSAAFSGFAVERTHVEPLLDRVPTTQGDVIVITKTRFYFFFSRPRTSVMPYTVLEFGRRPFSSGLQHIRPKYISRVPRVLCRVRCRSIDFPSEKNT